MPQFNQQTPMKAVPTKPTLVNRGPAGLLKKMPTKPGPAPEPPKASKRDSQINKIADALREAGLVHPISNFVLDAMNARVHPERNMDAIKDSLSAYGQVKPIVVRKATNVVVAGNGTITAARELGWTEIAASIVEMDELQAAGFGLADNRTAELAKWDFEIVAKLDKLLHEANQPSIGWSTDELEVLRAAEWRPPEISNELIQGGEKNLLLSFSPGQYELIERAIELFKSRNKNLRLPNEDIVGIICQEWITRQAVAKETSNASVQKTEPESQPKPSGPKPGGERGSPGTGPKPVRPAGL